MKRLLALLLALATALSLTACEFRTSEERKKMRAQMDYAKEAPSADSFDYALDDGTVLEPQVIYDANGVTVTILGMYETADEYVLPIRIYNSSDDWYSVYDNQCSVNGWQMTSFFFEQVCQNGMVDSDLRLGKSDYPESAGPVRELELNMSCSTEGDGNYYEFTFQTQLPREDGADSTALDGIYLTDTDSYSIVLLDCRTDEWSFYMDLAVINNSDRYLYLDASTSSPVINGTETDCICWSSAWLESSAKSLMSVYYNWYDLEEWDITSAREIESVSLEMGLEHGSSSDTLYLELDGETIQSLLNN